MKIADVKAGVEYQTKKGDTVIVLDTEERWFDNGGQWNRKLQKTTVANTKAGLPAVRIYSIDWVDNGEGGKRRVPNWVPCIVRPERIVGEVAEVRAAKDAEFAARQKAEAEKAKRNADRRTANAAAVEAARAAGLGWSDVRTAYTTDSVEVVTISAAALQQLLANQKGA